MTVLNNLVIPAADFVEVISCTSAEAQDCTECSSASRASCTPPLARLLSAFFLSTLTDMTSLGTKYALNYKGSPVSTSAKASSLSDEGPLEVSSAHWFIKIFPDVSFKTSSGIYEVPLHLIQYCLFPALLFSKVLLKSGIHWSAEASRLASIQDSY